MQEYSHFSENILYLFPLNMISEVNIWKDFGGTKFENLLKVACSCFRSFSTEAFHQLEAFHREKTSVWRKAKSVWIFFLFIYFNTDKSVVQQGWDAYAHFNNIKTEFTAT